MTYVLELWPEYVGVKRPKRFVTPPSLNKRLHWAARKKISDQFRNQTILLVKAAKIGRLKKAKVEVELHAIRAPDRDNLAASLKPILDGLVTARVISDDSDEYLDLQFRKTVKVHKKIREKILLFISKYKQYGKEEKQNNESARDEDK